MKTILTILLITFLITFICIVSLTMCVCIKVSSRNSRRDEKYYEQLNIKNKVRE